MNRIHASQFESAQGRRRAGDPGGPPPGTFTQQGGFNTTPAPGKNPSLELGWPCRDDCVPDLAGRLQRYLVYVPEAAAPAGGYGALVWLPGYVQSANDQVAGETDLFHQIGDRPDLPTLVLAVDGRGNEEWYYGQSGASVFEALADLRRHYPVDGDRTVMSGFSSGGYGANKLALQFPDVFSRAFICDGLDRAPSFPGLNGVGDTLPVDTVTQHEPGSKLTPLLPSRRNQPVMEWAGIPNDFIPYNITRERAGAYASGFYDYEFLSWVGASSEHVVMCQNGTWHLLGDWLGDMKRHGDPARVTYVRNPMMDDPGSGLVGDHAYWLSDIQSRDQNLGTIDVFSQGFGRDDPDVPAKETSAEVTPGTTLAANPYIREFRHLPDRSSSPPRNALDVTASNIASVTIDPQQARVDCQATLK